MKEEWRDVSGYEDSYQISSKGRLKSKRRLIDYGWKQAHRPSKVLTPRTCPRSGYVYTVFSVNKIRKTVKIHRLVAEAFIPNPENKPCVNHIDGNPSNNKLSNLEWVTHSENTRHAFDNGFHSGIKGEKSHLSKLTEEDVISIRNRYKKHVITQKMLSEEYGISVSQIRRILNKTNWPHI